MYHLYQTIIQKKAQRNSIRNSIYLAFIFALTFSLLLPNSLFAQSQGTRTFLPAVVMGGGDIIVDEETTEAATKEVFSTMAQAANGDELFALGSCSATRVITAYRSTAEKSFVGWNDLNNGQIAYAYSLRQWVDLFIYVKCGTRYYKYRSYGVRYGIQICNGYKGLFPLQTTCQSQLWDNWKSTSPGTVYIGSGSNDRF